MVNKEKPVWQRIPQLHRSLKPWWHLASESRYAMRHGCDRGHNVSGFCKTGRRYVLYYMGEEPSHHFQSTVGVYYAPPGDRIAKVM
ncbi:MAG: hypothetical protein K2L45_08365 [Muribaculaceae bacterium]|nr:hypothetical protein [Muribaculaceae bacterium]